MIWRKIRSKKICLQGKKGFRAFIIHKRDQNLYIGTECYLMTLPFTFCILRLPLPSSAIMTSPPTPSM
jgi:hypothetical protein